MQISGIAHIPPGWTIFHLVFPLAPAFTETNENFWTICVDNRSASLPAKKKMENLVAFYGWYNSVPLLFLVPKKATIWVWRKIFA